MMNFVFPILTNKLDEYTYLFSVKQIMYNNYSEITIGTIVINTQKNDYVIRIIPSPYSPSLSTTEETKLINSCFSCVRELERSHIMDKKLAVDV